MAVGRACGGRRRRYHLMGYEVLVSSLADGDPGMSLRKTVAAAFFSCVMLAACGSTTRTDAQISDGSDPTLLKTTSHRIVARDVTVYQCGPEANAHLRIVNGGALALDYRVNVAFLDRAGNPVASSVAEIDHVRAGDTALYDDVYNISGTDFPRQVTVPYPPIARCTISGVTATPTTK
jgi:hypothetical protein